MNISGAIFTTWRSVLSESEVDLDVGNTEALEVWEQHKDFLYPGLVMHPAFLQTSLKYLKLFRSLNLVWAGEWENHHEFWDLHMIANNLEYCWIAPEADCKPVGEYNSDDDYQLFYGNTTWADRVTLRPGSMLLLAPGEVHLPGISVENDQTPHIKAVVKIHRSLLEKK